MHNSLNIKLEYLNIRINFIVLNPLCREPEKTLIGMTRVRGCRQRFKPNVTRASGRKEPENSSRNDKMSHPESEEGTKKVICGVR